MPHAVRVAREKFPGAFGGLIGGGFRDVCRRWWREKLLQSVAALGVRGRGRERPDDPMESSADGGVCMPGVGLQLSYILVPYHACVNTLLG